MDSFAFGSFVHSDIFTDVSIFALVFAAIIHDFKHPGLTNSFLVHTQDDLAITYSDDSVLERFHLASGYRALFEYDFMSETPNDIR